MLDATQIILRPIVTEKSTWEGTARNRYAFEVNQHANKRMIRSAVQELYGVRVVGVATQNRTGKYRRTRWGTFKTSRPKKAVVQVHPEDRIELY